MKQIAKTEDQIREEKAEIARLVSELDRMTKRVPQSVMSGSYQDGVNWKKAAKIAYSAIKSSAPRLLSLRKAYSQLAVYS